MFSGPLSWELERWDMLLETGDGMGNSGQVNQEKGNKRSVKK